MSEKKDLEIIFNLQWKYGPKRAESSNIVGVYDLPSTTLKWERFKSYILKNSGTPGNDVKVSYMEDDRVLTIESTLDFQIALYGFRKKAMNGEIINLRLERLSNESTSGKGSPTCDAQTECNYDCKFERAPEWFVSYMAEFKKDVLNEVISTITTHSLAFKTSLSHSENTRSSKTECTKRCRKNHHFDRNEKEVVKAMKLEKKLESKMEKLVKKSKQLKEKKMALILKSGDSDCANSSTKTNSEAVSTIAISKMSAAPVRIDETIIPHLMGGEVYRHCWKIINNGSLPWTEDTELHFSWGSSLLEPIQRVLACPLLNPGEVGSIEALIHVPRICGRYQMYWHFHHRGRKFGHWLGCEIIVDKINSTEQLSASFLRNLGSQNGITALPSKINPDFESPHASSMKNSISVPEEKLETDMNVDIPVIREKMKDFYISENTSSSIRTHSFNELNQEIEDLIINKSPSKIQIVEKYSRSSDENKFEWNLDTKKESTHGIQKEHEEEAEESLSESITKIDEETSSNSTFNDMVMVNFSDELVRQPIEVLGARGENDYRNTALKSGTEQPENIHISYTPHDEKISTTNSNPYEHSETSDFDPLIDHFLQHIPNHQQTLPELRPKLHSYLKEFQNESDKISCSAKREIIDISTDNSVNRMVDGHELLPNEIFSPSCNCESGRQRVIPEASVQISSVVSDAMTMASSALKNVVNKIIPSKNEEELGVVINRQWEPITENSMRENNLKILADMGFNNRDHNATLLARYNDDLRRVVTELVQ